MYIHIGQNVVIPSDSVVGIFDIDNTTQSHITRAFLNGAENKGQIVNVSDDIPKSFILCIENGNRTVYLSQLASSTLLKRSENVSFE